MASGIRAARSEQAGAAPSERVYDVVVIGGGPVGVALAQRTGADGLSVVIVEKELLGGECDYWACVPQQGAAATGCCHRRRRVEGARKAVEGPLDAPAVSARRNGFLFHWHDDQNAALVKGMGADLVRGHGRLDGPRGWPSRLATTGGWWSSPSARWPFAQAAARRCPTCPASPRSGHASPSCSTPPPSPSPARCRSTGSGTPSPASRRSARSGCACWRLTGAVPRSGSPGAGPCSGPDHELHRVLDRLPGGPRRATRGYGRWPSARA